MERFFSRVFMILALLLSTLLAAPTPIASPANKSELAAEATPDCIPMLSTSFDTGPIPCETATIAKAESTPSADTPETKKSQESEDRLRVTVVPMQSSSDTGGSVGFSESRGSMPLTPFG